MSAQSGSSGLLGIGKQCSHPSCNLFDFLPFKCHHCEDHFCQDHFKVEAHSCPKYDETKHNRVAPNCPLCSTPVATRPGQDPNVRMEEHFERECSITTGKDGKASTVPVCARPSCKKVLFSPIRCDGCREQFCPSHRFPSDHNCAPRPTPAPKPGLSNMFSNASSKNASARPSAGATALSSFKKSLSSASTGSPTPASKPAPPPSKAPTKAPAQPAPAASSSGLNPFSKTDSPPSPPIISPLSCSVEHLTATKPGNTTHDDTNANAVPILPKPIIFNYNNFSFVPRSVFATA